MESISPTDQKSVKAITRFVSQRWTEKLAAKGWTPICHDFVDRFTELPQPLTPTEAMLVILLMRFKWDDRNPFPSLKRLAGMLGLKSTAIRNHVRSLESKGCLQRVYRTGYSNAFDLNPLFRLLENLPEKTKRRPLVENQSSGSPLPAPAPAQHNFEDL